MDKQSSAKDSVTVPLIPSAVTDSDEAKSSSVAVAATATASLMNDSRLPVQQSVNAENHTQPQKVASSAQVKVVVKEKEVCNVTTSSNVAASTTANQNIIVAESKVVVPPTTTQLSRTEVISSVPIKQPPPPPPSQPSQKNQVQPTSIPSTTVPPKAVAPAPDSSATVTSQPSTKQPSQHLPHPPLPYHPYYYPPPYYYGYPPVPYHHHHPPYHPPPYPPHDSKTKDTVADEKTIKSPPVTATAPQNPPTSKETTVHSTIASSSVTNQGGTVVSQTTSNVTNKTKKQNHNGTLVNQTKINATKNAKVQNRKAAKSASSATKAKAIRSVSSIPTPVPSAAGSSDINKQEERNDGPFKTFDLYTSDKIRTAVNVALPLNKLSSTSHIPTFPLSVPPHLQQQGAVPQQQAAIQTVALQQKHDFDESLMRTPIKSNTRTTSSGLNIPRLRDQLGEKVPISSDEANASVTIQSQLNDAKLEQKTTLCKVTKPMVMVDQLTYDWSSLKLDGTKAWNQLLEQSSCLTQTNEDTHSDDQPRITALHTYQLMQNLKASLFGNVIAPNSDSPLHRIKDQTHDSSDEVPDDCPEELKPLFANAAAFYRTLLQDRTRFRNEKLLIDTQSPEPQEHPTLKERYQLMTANELRQYMKQTKHEISSLRRKQRRIINTAKKLKLYPCTKNEGCSMQESQSSPSRHHMYNDDEIRTRYRNHFCKRSNVQLELVKSNGASTESTTGSQIRWQDDDISTLYKKYKSSVSSLGTQANT